LRDSGQLHSRYSSLYDARKWGSAPGANTASLRVEAPGNFGGVALTGGFMRMSARNMEMLIRGLRAEGWQDFEIRNCSNGVRIEGTVPQRSEELDFSALPPLDRGALRERVIPGMLFHIGLTRDQVLGMVDARSYQALAAQLLFQWKRRPRTRLSFLKRMESSAEYLAGINQSPQRFASYMVEGSLNTFFILALKGLYMGGDERAGLAAANAVIDRYCMFLRDSVRAYAFLPDYVMGEHQRLARHRVGYGHPGSRPPRMRPMPRIAANPLWQDPQRKFTKVTSGEGGTPP
nr:hypothetical protein [Succinivibrionaceae bacterium]